MEGREEEREEPECEGPDPLTSDTDSSPVNSDPQTLHPKDGDCSPDPDTDEAEDGDVPPTKANQKTSSVAHSKAGLADSKAVLSSKIVPGIIYLGHIPPRLRPQQMRTMLSVYGTVGRIFLQPEDGQVRKKKKKAGHKRCDFTEGWVEFRDKRIAKRVALSLHNTPMGTRKRQHFSSDLWSIKYLHRFQWTHLSERLAYEQTVLHQRLRTEVSQAKRETNFYLNNVERSAAMTTKRRRGGEQEQKTWDFTQRQTEDEIQTRKKRKESVTQKPRHKDRLHTQQSQSNVSLLAKIFNSNKSD